MQQIEPRERGRAEIVAAIGDARDVTLIRGLGDAGDELSWAGTRALLSDRRYREISLDELSSSSGDVGLLAAGGAFSGRYHEWGPAALAVAELRFERVIMLPISFDVTVGPVREVLRSTRAVVFARELDSFRLIRELCEARLAPDGAFYYDYEPHRAPGSGTLSADRTSSVPAGSLEDRLTQIAGHAVIRTDCAQVMIAGALLGKRIELGSARSPELDAIADYSLAGFPIVRAQAGAEPAGAVRRDGPRERVSPELVVLIGRDVELADAAVDRLAAELEDHPEAIAVGARLTDPDGRVLECGGELRERDGVVEFRRGGETDWLLHSAVLIRRAALAEFPIERETWGAYADLEWSYRVSRQHPGALRRCAEPLGRAGAPDARREPADFRERSAALTSLAAIARFQERYGLLIAEDLGRIFPGLRRDAARLLLTIFAAIGPERFLMLWAGGGLEPVLAREHLTSARLARELDGARGELEMIRASRAWRVAGSYYRIRSAVRRRGQR